jgi:hypothetical protein
VFGCFFSDWIFISRCFRTLCPIFIGLLMKMEQTVCSETLAHKIQTMVNRPKERIQCAQRGESLKSRIFNMSFWERLHTWICICELRSRKCWRVFVPPGSEIHRCGEWCVLTNGFLCTVLLRFWVSWWQKRVIALIIYVGPCTLSIVHPVLSCWLQLFSFFLLVTPTLAHTRLETCS